ncbi:DUF2306 domain-containing protein [Thalassovita sp.]|uniref:DUF2306 domain-containing protein n=1 Tax=Thalassovita sp. TaxID=1979401 RepID=UPI0028825F0D|nr:DUF2306 domain-containing protein [Thalassovita sp.]MDF1804136.1 DUF2306 domain-containing protein [Thalassovita sp.]
MSLTPLLESPFAIQIHALAAVLLIPLTLVIFAIERGSPLHKRLGWAWVIGMALVAISSFWISELRIIGAYSPIHLLSLFTLGALVFGVTSIRTGQVSRHRKTMKGITLGALVTAGAFTLLPGRIMHAVLIGG